jgi:CubicO group peptidase (beta-lactamase class C family)
MALGHVLERLAGEPLEVQAHRLFERVGLAQDLQYGPIRDGEVAPTEDCPWRGRLLRGEVHDENASSLGGISGHAGLFGTLRGVDGYARALLDERLHSAAVVEYASREHVRGAISGERRGFGWMLRHPGWSGGDLASDRTIGHTGFTGTGLWIDLERCRYSVLLSNRVHPSRHVESGIAELRRSFNHAAHA